MANPAAAVPTTDNAPPAADAPPPDTTTCPVSATAPAFTAPAATDPLPAGAVTVAAAITDDGNPNTGADRVGSPATARSGGGHHPRHHSQNQSRHQHHATDHERDPPSGRDCRPATTRNLPQHQPTTNPPHHPHPPQQTPPER